MIAQITKDDIFTRFSDKRYYKHQYKSHDRKPQQFLVCDDEDALLSHAKLRHFANKYEISSLKRLSLHKLQQSLILHDEDLKTGSKVVALLRYVYQKISKSNDSDEVLRELVVGYLARAVDDLSINPRFQTLLKEEN